MKTKKNKKEESNLITESELSDLMDDELTDTIEMYHKLLKQCEKLADCMGYYSDYVIGKVMPSRSIERTNTARIKEWFEKEKKSVIARILKRQEEEERDRKIGELLDSLNLTPEQAELLGFARE
jgi:predicted ribosome quality control (RQC) complex YloA/Tae2 family protein